MPSHTFLLGLISFVYMAMPWLCPGRLLDVPCLSDTLVEAVGAGN